MHYPDVNNEITVPHQYSQGSAPPRASSKRRGGLCTGVVIALTLLLAVVFGTGLFAGWQFGRSNTPAGGPATTMLQPGTGQGPSIPTLTASNLETVRKAVVAKVRPAVVQVNVATPRGQGLGSGVIIDRRGYIVTNNHVVEGARRLEVVLYDGTKLPGQLVGTDPADDLAVVKITPPKAGLTVAALGDSSKSQVGQEVLAIGNPLGITQTVTNGIISAVGRNVSEGQNGATIPNAIQTDAPINPGNSGGALVDLQGHVIGIPTLTAIDPQFRTPANGVGFAIPSNRVQFIAPQIIETGKVTHTGRAAQSYTLSNT
jgi:S1-C subfamily serine protease